MAAEPVSGTSRPRRSQAERSAATREALLDATVASLVEDGYSGTTTSRVAERAGVSRGAHLHHFQTRQALVAAAIVHLAERRREDFDQLEPQMPQGPERVLAALDLVFENYVSPLFQASVDLWSHARTDPELRATLVDAERELDRRTRELARFAFGARAERPDFDRLFELAVAAIRGLALLDTLSPGSGRARKQWVSARLELARLF